MPSPLHPHYDEAGVFYDAGFFYSDGIPEITPTPKRKKPMASLSPGLFRLNPAQLIALADLVAPLLAPTPPATPPLPNLSAKVASLKTKRDAAKAASDAYEAAKASLVSLKEARDAAADDLRNEHKALVSAVESEAKGDPTQLSSSGYALAAPNVQSSTPPAQILNLVVTAGDMDGALDVSWDPESNSRTYEVQIATVDPVAGPWTTKEQPTASSTQLTGLTSGSRVWIRVRGIGAKGQGPWSDPATKIVP